MNNHKLLHDDQTHFSSDGYIESFNFIYNNFIHKNNYQNTNVIAC